MAHYNMSPLYTSMAMTTSLLFLHFYPSCNKNALHHIHKSCVNQLTWWSQTLACEKPIHSLMRLPDCDPDIWVDASLSWGISIVIVSCWAAWRLLFGWKSEGQDIGWAEAVAVELTLLCLGASSWQDAHIKIHCDNSCHFFFLERSLLQPLV